MADVQPVLQQPVVQTVCFYLLVEALMAIASGLTNNGQ